MASEKRFCKIPEEIQGLKYFHILCIIYIAGMMASLTVSARLFPFHIPLTNFTILLTAGTWTIPLSFFIQDITTEVYGYEKSRHLVQISFLILLIYITFLKWTTILPIPGVKNISNAYNTVFNALPRHLFALLGAIFTGNLINNYLLSKLKKKLKGKYLPLRFIFSTAIGEAVLQAVGTTIAWIGNLNFTEQILPFILSSYLYKILFETVMTPLNIFVSNWLKKNENIDIYDNNINYNPFVFNFKKKS